MASETYFGVRDRVRYADGWNDEIVQEFGLSEEIHAALNSLTGRVVEVDESSRECCYYLVAWDGVSAETAAQLWGDEGFEHVAAGCATWEQSDALCGA